MLQRTIGEEIVVNSHDVFPLSDLCSAACVTNGTIYLSGSPVPRYLSSMKPVYICQAKGAYTGGIEKDDDEEAEIVFTRPILGLGNR